ncbi:MAP kinase phosphatase with leucine-rich repeats protein 3 [Linepithema humile]|uniref:MAP kinase phosphatase with leucine-rich repeats protein 3 n=1 Tax=Linepithema humile TaxID=83485 RepID=UPI0006236AE1|nr:PREDICTED: rho-associated protein kinase 2-like [Linepithema humile]
MQQEFYTSCIKINGMPLLPPLMTDSVKEEMKRYKSLAVKVEEKLKDRQVKGSIRDKCVQADMMESTDTLKSIRYSSDSDLSNYNTTSDTNNSDTYSKLTIVEPTTIRQNTGEPAEEHDIETPTSDIQQSQSQVLLANKTVDESKPTTPSTDQNVSAIEVASNKNAVSSENWKPEVPRTLDIVPITLSDQEEVTTVSKENESLPKLSRQGSYILDTPSPILLAHMHTELTDENYTPTPTTAISQRKKWNIAQPKVEWENKQFVAEDTEASNKLECKAEESTSQHTKSDTLTESYQAINSASCAEAVISEQRADTTPIKHNYVSNIDFTKQSSLEKSNRDSDTSVSNVANKSQESTEDVNNSKKQLSHVDENKCHDKVEDTKKHKDTSVKTKPSITPEKLLIVYKEIEEMHRKQMMELINRQRREQSLLQAEFQKQQMLLLAEIRKYSVSGVSHPVVSSQPKQSLPSKEVKLGDNVSEMKQQRNINSPGNYRAGAHCKLPSANVIVCPLDYISSKNLYMLKHKSPPFIMNTSPTALDLDFARKIDLCNITYTNNNNNDNDNDHNSNYKSHDRTVYKSSSVSRQLFPLESNTTHVPVLDTSAYHDKHIRAVNIINAYTRGYLVRRLMRTERVITLKRVYKEALQCMLKLHVDAPLNLAEVDFLHRLQLQCDAASMNIVELFAQSPSKRMQAIMQDRELQQSRAERPTSARSYSFATQKTLARKNLREFESTMTKYQRPLAVKRGIVRSRCQTWTSDMRDKLMSPSALHQGIRRSTSTGAVRKPWR